MNSGNSWLCAELMRTKSGYSDWAVNPKTIWPQWSWEHLGALANWWRGNKIPFSVQNVSHFKFAWDILMGFPEKTDPAVFRAISHLDIEGLQDYRLSLINGSRRTLAGN